MLGVGFPDLGCGCRVQETFPVFKGYTGLGMIQKLLQEQRNPKPCDVRDCSTRAGHLSWLSKVFCRNVGA